MIKSVIGLNILLLCIKVYAEDCEQAPNMAAVRACIERQSVSEYEKQFKSLYDLLKQKGMNQAASALTISQNQWINYRNSTCDYVHAIASSSQSNGYYGDHKTNCIADFNTSREKILVRYKKLCEKSKNGCDLN